MPDKKGLAAAALGEGPFTYRVELVLDGRRLVATATWPADEIVGMSRPVRVRASPRAGHEPSLCQESGRVGAAWVRFFLDHFGDALAGDAQGAADGGVAVTALVGGDDRLAARRLLPPVVA